MAWDELTQVHQYKRSETYLKNNIMKEWRKIIFILVLIILAYSISKCTMISNNDSNTSKYKLEHVEPKGSKLKLSGEALKELNQKTFLVATVKVAKEKYVPPGVEVRTWISPLIFTANIPREVLNRLERDPAVISIEPAYKLRSN